MNALEKTTDQELIIAVKRNEPGAFGELYSRYYRKALRKCLSIVKNDDEAFDLAEEAILKALNSLNNFRGDASFSTWLYVIVHRHCLDFLRKKNKQKFTSLDADNSAIEILEEGEENSGERMEMEKIMLELIEKMPATEKSLLLQKYGDGKSIGDLQESFQISASAVKMRLKRSKEKLNQVYAVALTVGLTEALSML